MIYLDTSYIVPLFLAERETANVRKRLAAASAGAERMVTSDWTRTELASAVGLKVRRGELQRDDALRLLPAIDRFITGSLTEVLPVHPADFSLAANYLQYFDLGLRGGDALHLAICANHGIKELLTFDKILAKAVRHFKL